ncbi:XRE family transcriptional regulator [Bacillus seohaeanensis]|jgi:transcriptional regulator with XRE-family HTH domain|uniref:XRE family transcriptional regulator n=1 Tax=Bacillus seohaeanensis TaxID=284580 RepID=A0ABW5RKU1_9BACI
MKLKSNIGWLIDKLYYTRADLMRIFNKFRNTISAWCASKSYPNTLGLFHLADLLGVKVDDLYDVITVED